jgi:hypothetical protein
MDQAGLIFCLYPVVARIDRKRDTQSMFVYRFGNNSRFPGNEYSDDEDNV